jgi:hypothetical protein
MTRASNRAVRAGFLFQSGSFVIAWRSATINRGRRIAND